MSHHYFLNKDYSYRPCNLSEWSNQFEHMERHIGSDIVNDKHVSTVWLGLDHQWGTGGEPLVFETMIFDEPRGGREIYMNQYTTYKQALEGHKKAIQWVLDGCNDDTR